MISRHSDTQRAKGCFVEFESAEALEIALKRDGKPLMGRDARVKVAQPRDGRSRARQQGRRGDRGGGKGRSRVNDRTWTEPPLPSKESAKERPKLKLKQRSENIANNSVANHPRDDSKSNPFGGARPADTASKLAEIELRDLETKFAEKIPAKPKIFSKKLPDPCAKQQRSQRRQGNGWASIGGGSKKNASRNSIKTPDKITEEAVPTKIENPFDLLADE